MNLEGSLDGMLEKVRTLMQADTVIGKSIETPDGTVVPVCRVALGFGAGGKESKGETLGAGGGAVITPVAFLILREGKTELVSLEKGAYQFGKILDLVPELIEQFRGIGGQKTTLPQEASSAPTL